ncbi:MAG: NAD-dependent succinate-semialdehyde dehydrogenase [Calditrichota bacterium]
MKNLSDKALFKTQAYINGEWITKTPSFPVYNPATGEHVSDVSNVSAAEAKIALEAASETFKSWKHTTAAERAIVLNRWAELLEEHREDLAIIMTTEQGKPLAEARGEINYSIAFFRWYAEEAKRIYGDVIPTHNPGLRNLVIKQPVGVVAAITPWNFPVAMIAKKLPAALAAGCTMVWKPSEETPLSALALAELGERAGLPKGVFNVLPTLNAQEIGWELTSSSLVRKVSFTGSTGVGKLLLKQSAETVKKVSLELGGNAPFIVFEDADIDAAVSGAIASKFRNAGQTCVCANRIYVQDSVYEAFTEKYAAEVQRLRVGNGIDGNSVIGPLINQQALEKVETLIEDAVSKGAEVMLGGERHSLGQTFFQPTVLRNVTLSARMSREEIFGPVAPIFKFKTEEEVVELANATEFGLASYFYARDIGRIWRVSEALEYGMVGINTGMISTAVAPFGGIKESGLGREGSKYGLDDYMEIKFMCMGIQ